MNYEIYFPRGIATGEAFCNREEERKRLAKNIQTGQHTLLMSPRRYGKTSLVNHVITEMGIPFGETDFFVVVDAKRIEQQLLAGIKVIFTRTSSSLEQTLRVIRDYFKKINSKWVIGTQGLSIALIPAIENDPATNIMEALLALESFLAYKKERAVLFLDEVQEIGEVAEGKGIEGAIRHVAQQSKYLSFVFSGSSRHLLSKMFFDKTRPLFKLCDRITLDRISETSYEKHFNKLALKRWGKKLAAATIKNLLDITECHPFYVNNLCLRLWEVDAKLPPTIEDIANTWNIFVKEERLETARELSALSTGQRKILIAMASGSRRTFTGKEFLKTVNMSASSIKEALNVLEKKDYIEHVDQEYTIIDPLIKASLNIFSGKSTG